MLLSVFAARCEPRLTPVLADQIKVARGIWVSAHHDMQYVPRIKAVTRFLCDKLAESAGILLDLHRH